MSLSNIVFKISYLFGLTHFIAWFNRHKVSILCYHSITSDTNSISNDPWKLTLCKDKLESHLFYLHNKYNVISLDTYLKSKREGIRLPAYSAVLTFDDGMKNFHTAAAPILSKYSMPATVMVITDYADEMSAKNPNSKQDQKWTAEDGEQYLSWEEMEYLNSNHSIEFGSHTCSHPRLTLLPLKEADNELKDSRRIIEHKLKQPSISFSYPHGQHTKALAKLVEKAGYACGLTSIDGKNSKAANPYLLKRSVVLSNDDMATFAARLAGISAYWLNFKSALRPVKNTIIAILQPELAKNLSPVPKPVKPERAV